MVLIIYTKLTTWLNRAGGLVAIEIEVGEAGFFAGHDAALTRRKSQVQWEFDGLHRLVQAVVPENPARPTGL